MMLFKKANPNDLRLFLGVRLGARLGLGTVAAALAAGAVGASCSAQGVPPDFLSPILVLNARGHTDQIQALEFSADGRRLFSGGRDKVVHVWEVDGRSLRLERSIRPPIRRRGGRVHALAVSPVADSQGQRLLAVAGIGAIGSRGGVLVYRAPGRVDREAGDLLYELSPDNLETPTQQRRGHGGAVFGLSFAPDGRHLASCSEDDTVRVWDLQGPTPRTVAVLEGHAGDVTAVSFVGQDRIVSGGGAKDGSVRLWDWKGKRLAAWVPCADQDLAADEGQGVYVSALAVSPNGRHVVVGRENGRLERYDGADLGGGLLLNPETAGELRPVEALAVSPDGNSLAASILKYQASIQDAPRKECEVVVFNLPEGRPSAPSRTIDGFVKALAFSPDGRALAVAGGEAWQITMLDPQGRAVEPDSRADGPGTVLWEAGFVDSKPTVAFSRSRPADPNATVWEAFDLIERRFKTVAPGTALSRSVRSAPGWKFTPRAFDRIALEPAAGAEVAVSLSPLDGRWSSYTFIPANAQAGHPKLCVAIGCEEGSVLVYSLPDGVRTRVLLGHGGAVQGVAPSADGRWLITSSADMTLALWSLSGCDARPVLGAEIAPDGQGPGGVVRRVDPRSFAERMGLKVGDRVERVAQHSRRGELAIETLDGELSAVAPSLEDQTSFQVRRPGGDAPIRMAASRADVPLLSLFPGGDREWIVWMPEGFYETSIAGDRRLLGWQVNHLDARDPNRWVSLPSEFFPMSRYENQLRKPEVIDALLRTGDAVAALAPTRGGPSVQKPPAVRVIDPRPLAPGAAIVAPGPELTLRIEAEAAPERRVRSLIVHADTTRYPVHAFDPPPALASATERIRLRPDANTVSIEATDDQGVTAIETLEVRLDARLAPPSVLPRRSRLAIRSFGVEKFQERAFPEIPNARRDAEKLAAFLARPDGRSRFEEDQIDLKDFSDADVDANQILGAFDELAEEARTNRLKAGDTLFVVLESHMLKTDSEGSVLLSAASALRDKVEGAVSGAAVADRLEEVTKNGCLVMLLIDGLHATIPGAGSSTIREWVRDLSDRRGVLVLAASKQDPSERLADLGAFARAVLESTTVAAGSADRRPPNATVTLYDFQRAVLRRVSELTGRRQYAGFYPPETLAGWNRIRIFDPQAAPVESLVKQ